MKKLGMILCALMLCACSSKSDSSPKTTVCEINNPNDVITFTIYSNGDKINAMERVEIASYPEFGLTYDDAYERGEYNKLYSTDGYEYTYELSESEMIEKRNYTEEYFNHFTDNGGPSYLVKEDYVSLNRFIGELTGQKATCK